ncbi:ribonuclease E/G-like protein, chloroplastic isoform X2 [Cryptomeria japonica]|uniref:ribonuclease E/G-like protein, chloroplastic isoform X2 n=1 Tax=Cryptomeria japonica TaxID=3369 RepID=UPI0027D9F093|nr:ribonuclease E/G-like protein, chloroplastic isoform X2 [Cryptomeria japonica]
MIASIGIIQSKVLSMECLVLCNLQHVCWSRGRIGLSKLDSEQLPLATCFSWEFRRRKQRENGFGLLWIRTCDPWVHLPLKALKKGIQSANARKQNLKIIFNLEAVVEDGQQLYVSGSVISLGMWDPELAIPMSPFEGKTNLWQARIQVACGTILEYNYFVKRNKVPSGDITWRPGPTLCLKVRSSVRTSKKTVVVQDCWCDTACGNIPVLSLGASWEDVGAPDQPNGFVGLESSNVDDISAEYSEAITQQISCQLVSAVSGTVSGNIYNVPEKPISPVISTQVHTEHDGINSELLPKGVFEGKDPDVPEHCKNLEGKKIVYQPIEESWLPAGFILLKEENESQNLTVGTGLDGVVVPEAKESESRNLMLGIELDGVGAVKEGKGSESQILAVEIGMDGCATVAEPEEGLQRELKLENGAQSIESQEKQGVKIVINKDVVTEIIVNSSVCTIQRIAILEDGKPVEILLEPEVTNVQVGSIYLGVVRSICHRMGAAFVDIGDTSLAFLSIKEPFPFLSLDLHVKEGSSDGDLSNNAGVESGLKDEEEEFHELLESAVQEDEISTTYEHTKHKKEVLDGGLKDSDNMGELSKFEIDTNNLSSANVEVGDNLSENGHETEGTVVKQYGSEDLCVGKGKKSNRHLQNKGISYSGPSSVDFARNPNKSSHIKEGAKIIVQVIKEDLGKKRPRVTMSPCLNSRFWALLPGKNRAAVSLKITGLERKRLIQIAQTLKPFDCGLIVRTVAAGHSYEELQKDFIGLMETWKEIVTCAKSASLAAKEGVEGAVPVILHRAMGQILSVVQNHFNEEVERMVVDSPHTYHEVTSYLQEFAPSLVSRVELYSGKNLIFDEFGVETEIDNLLCKRVNFSSGGYLIIEQTEALVSIDVNSGKSLLGQEMSKKQPILEVNLAAARQIARELRLRDIGGIIVVDFIDMKDEEHKRMVYEEIRKAAQRDRSPITFSELSDLGLMEISRKRVRPSLTYMFSEPCSYCNANGRVEARDTIFSKIERAIRRLLAKDEKSWPQILLWVDAVMSDYLTSGKKTRVELLRTTLKVRIDIEVKREFERDQFEVKQCFEFERGFEVSGYAKKRKATKIKPRLAETSSKKLVDFMKKSIPDKKVQGEISGTSSREKTDFAKNNVPNKELQAGLAETNTKRSPVLRKIQKIKNTTRQKNV